jgi:hypothetical protein
MARRKIFPQCQWGVGQRFQSNSAISTALFWNELVNATRFAAKPYLVSSDKFCSAIIVPQKLQPRMDTAGQNPKISRNSGFSATAGVNPKQSYVG